MDKSTVPRAISRRPLHTTPTVDFEKSARRSTEIRTTPNLRWTLAQIPDGNVRDPNHQHAAKVHRRRPARALARSKTSARDRDEDTRLATARGVRDKTRPF